MRPKAALANVAAAARALADALAELASDVDAPPADQFDSLHLPPRTSRRRFAELCRSGRIPGAHQEGQTWVCSRDAWHAARSRVRPSPRRAAPSNPTSLEQHAEELLRRRGLRLARGVSAGKGAE